MAAIIDAILAIDPTAWVGCSNENINRLRWHDGNPNNITEKQILAKQAELAAAYPLQELREQRNALLVSSDWTGLSDVDMTNEKLAEWKLYRQKLRDLPSGLDTEFKVKNVAWPISP